MAERARRSTTESDIRKAGPMPVELPPCCAEWRVDDPHGWQLFLTCGFHRSVGCDHEHHRNEVWLAA